MLDKTDPDARLTMAVSLFQLLYGRLD